MKTMSSQRPCIHQGTERGEYARELVDVPTERSKLLKCCAATLRASQEQHGECSWNSSHRAMCIHVHITVEQLHTSSMYTPPVEHVHTSVCSNEIEPNIKFNLTFRHKLCLSQDAAVP